MQGQCEARALADTAQWEVCGVVLLLSLCVETVVPYNGQYGTVTVYWLKPLQEFRNMGTAELK